MDFNRGYSSLYMIKLTFFYHQFQNNNYWLRNPELSYNDLFTIISIKQEILKKKNNKIKLKYEIENT